MAGLGTIINVVGVLAGGFLGMLFGKFLTEKIQDSLTKVCGICVLFIGIAGALEGMLKITGDSVTSSGALLIVICLAVGMLIGEILDLEGKIEKFGSWLKRKSGNAKDPKFVDAFVTTSLTICIGAMAIIGAIEDGINGDYSILFTKTIIDLITVMVLTCSLGKGCIFAAIPVALLQGVVTALARFIQPVMTDASLANISMVGSVLIFCVGLNLVWGKKLRVANMLPGLIIAAVMAFVPFNI